MIKRAVCPTCASINRIAPGHAPASAKCGKCGASLMLDGPIEVDDDTLPKHRAGTKGPLILDVWAPWCGPCIAMAPNFKEAAQQLAGQARLVKLNSDENRIAESLNISGIPALLLLKDGKEAARSVGMMTAKQIVAWVHEHIDPPKSLQSQEETST